MVAESHCRWQTFVFRGETPAAATEAFDEWYGHNDVSHTKQPILRASGHLFMYVTHCPYQGHYEIHVSALIVGDR
jgi:hypothetical protein